MDVSRRVTGVSVLVQGEHRMLNLWLDEVFVGHLDLREDQCLWLLAVLLPESPEEHRRVMSARGGGFSVTRVGVAMDLPGGAGGGTCVRSFSKAVR